MRTNAFFLLNIGISSHRIYASNYKSTILHITNIVIYKFKIPHIKIKTSLCKIDNVTQKFDINEPTQHILFITNKSTRTKTQHKLFRIDKSMCYGSKLTFQKGEHRLNSGRLWRRVFDICQW